jgi:hypothetical protein
MKIIVQILKNHLISIIAFLLYSVVCIHTLQIGMAFRERFKNRLAGESGISLGGEGVMWADVFLFLIGCAFVLVSCGYAIFSRQEPKFYVWLISIIILETVITFYFG